MENIKDPTLSIIMPFYNNKELVAEMIDSILANNFQDWELLAIDDGSSQDTLEYLSKYNTDKRIYIIKRTILPKGAQTCRNIGIELMKGKYVVFFDSDDYITKTCLGTRVERISNRTDVDFLVFPSATYSNNVFNPKAPEYIYGYNVYNDDVEAFARRELPFIVWNNIYKSESIKSHNLKWDTKLLSLQDADFNLQAILSGLKYGYELVPADYGYRINYNTTSISRKICSEEHINSHIYATDKFFSCLQQKFGHKYDNAIKQGLLCIYNRIFANGIEKDFALMMAKCVKRHNTLHGVCLMIQIYVTCMLEKVIPAKKARQITMFLYLSKHLMRLSRARKRIKELNGDI